MFTKSGIEYKNIKFDNKLLIGAEKAVNYKGVLIITEETVSGMNCRITLTKRIESNKSIGIS